MLLALVTTGCGNSRPAPMPRPGGASDARLVVLSPAMGVILTDLGARSVIVGRHDVDQVLTDLPACGHQGGIDYETLLAVRPTHVLIEWGARPLPERLVTLAAANGWTIERHDLRTLGDITSTSDQLQREFGAAGDEPLSAALERSWARSDKPLGRAGTVLLLGATAPPGAIGPESCHYEILTRLGARPAIREGAPWIELDSEDLIALAPDAIVLIEPQPGGTGIAAVGPEALDRLGVIASLDIPAVRDGRVAVLDGVSYLTPSTAMAQFAADLRTVLEDWADEAP